MEKDRGNQKENWRYYSTQEEKRRESSKGKLIRWQSFHICSYRKFSTSNWRTSKRDICPKTTIWSLSNDTKKREKFKMLFSSKRKRKLSKLKWSNNKTNKEKDKICLELSKRTKWRIKLDFNRRDLLKWKWKRREEENKLLLKETTR